jgi:hypothetical protein
MIYLFSYPQSARFERILPKNKIYDHAKPGKAIKQLFVSQVDRITWQYKLSHSTINIAATKAVPEIQIFRISIKAGEIKHDVLRCIDQAIPFPIIFEVAYEDRIKEIAAYKRPSEADKTKWVVSNYFETPWLPEDSPREALPFVVDLGRLYDHLLAPLLPYTPRPGERLQHLIDRIEKIDTKKQEIGKCESRLKKEKQFNRKVEINAQLRSLINDYEKLIK